jgi:hypothetical protein
MKYTRHVASIGKRKKLHAWFWWGNPREEVHLDDLGVDGRIILKFILQNRIGVLWTGLIWLRLGRGERTF